jgi:hypothetical protein
MGRLLSVLMAEGEGALRNLLIHGKKIQAGIK